ncbi:hypothetical protein GCM10009525_17450 [Streptosporangium amethystogenes subsp. fukuiense]
MTAVMMAQQLPVYEKAEHEEVAGFARTVRSDQHAEMFRMRHWPAAWFGERNMPRMPTGACLSPTGSG